MRDVLLNYLEKNNIIVTQQYVLDQVTLLLITIIRCYGKMFKLMNSSLDFDCIYLYFAKVFDRVTHCNHLSIKLYQIGIHSCILEWTTYFLFNRRQRVLVDGIYLWNTTM